MKKFLILSILFIILLLFPQKSYAYEQSEGVCYSQCAAHKFVWKGDFCWDMFKSQCSMGEDDAEDAAKELLKDAAISMASGKRKMIVDVDPVFTNLFICMPLIKDCIVPILNECKKTCTDISQTYYAPNLYVGNQYGSTIFQNIFYSEERHELSFKVTNDGGYAWDIDVTASWGHTPKRDKIVSGGGTLFTEKIPELLFFGARIGSPKEPGDYVKDFLIDETNFSSWLSKYKSDKDHHYIPPAWYKTIHFVAPDNEYTKITLNVDPNNIIPEASEGDNMTIYEIDKLPTPFYLLIENLKIVRTNPASLTDYNVSFELKNDGEDSGNAHIKWYDGNYESGKNPIYEQNQAIAGLNKVSFNQDFSVDVSRGRDSCNSSHKYTMVVFDDDGFIKTRQEVSIPVLAGSIYGRVDDLFGKKVAGATITANTGQTATTDASGNYHIGGIATLGKITLTVSHPSFSKTETKEVELKFDDSKDKCHIEGLTHIGINFVLKDQDAVFTVTLKDAAGNPVNGHVLATNKMSDDEDIAKTYFRLDKDINGTGELGALQPGQYMFTIDAGGYKTIAQVVSAVPDNQHLEFTLEPLLGRRNEGDMVIGPPRLLWQMDLGTEILSNISATKDGKRVIIFTTKNKPDTGKLYFLESITGQQLKTVNTPANGGNSQTCLSTSYDGNTTALLTHKGVPGIGNTNPLILFDSSGNEFARNDKWTGGGVGHCSVSYDGFYIYPGRLINKGMYKYSRMEIEGIGGYSFQGYSSLGPLYFLHGNGLIAGCKNGEGQCAQHINTSEIYRFGDLKDSIRVVDSSYNDAKVIFASFDKLYVFGNGTKIFEKEINASGQEPSSSISMGGVYIIYSHNDPGVHNADFKILNGQNDVTPDYEKDKNENVIFVHANDKGLFYLAKHAKIFKYYQVGKYTDEYNPQTVSPTTTPEWIDGLSIYSNGLFSTVAGLQTFQSLIPKRIYRANKDIKIAIIRPWKPASLGTLSIAKDTLFAVDMDWNPILLKGQMTAEFSSQATIYAIKFDRDSPTLFEQKLQQFISKTLPESEYFIIKNIHTRFTLVNQENSFNTAVESGQVSVKAGKIEKIIDSGKQITIDADNNIKESIYFNNSIYIIVFGILLLILTVVLFIYRKTKIGGQIINIIKLTGLWILKITKFILILVWKVIKYIYHLIRRGVKKKREKKKN